MEKPHRIAHVSVAQAEATPELASARTSFRQSGYVGLGRFSQNTVNLPWRISPRAFSRDVQDALKDLDRPPPPLPAWTVESLEGDWSIEKEEDYHIESASHNLPADLRTRNICVLGLAIGWMLALLLICFGAVVVATPPVPLLPIFRRRMVSFGILTQPFVDRAVWYQGHRVFVVPDSATVAIPLIVNVVLTLVLDSISYIHATSLRWALWREGRLELNRSLRLLSASKSHSPNTWPVNVVCAIALALCYGSISVMTSGVYIEGVVGTAKDAGGVTIVQSTTVEGPRYALDFNGWGVLGVGLGLFIQAAVSTWCLFSQPELILTWSSNPLSCARVCVAWKLANGSEPSHIGDSANNPPVIDKASYPLDRQPAMNSCIRSVQWVLYAAWLLFGASALWTIILGAVAAMRWKATNTSYVLEMGGRTNIASFWQWYGLIYFIYGTINHRAWLCLIIQGTVQAIPALGLHCVELLVQLTNDEAVWRKASSITGAQPGTDGIYDTVREWLSWPTIALFLFKSIIQWVFGYAFTATMVVVTMALLPALAVSALTLLLALFAEYLARRQPVGSQPATYGSIAALSRLVDVWADNIWFGDKGEQGGVGLAGTSPHRGTLQHVRMDKLYFGLRTGIH